MIPTPAPIPATSARDNPSDTEFVLSAMIEVVVEAVLEVDVAGIEDVDGMEEVVEMNVGTEVVPVKEEVSGKEDVVDGRICSDVKAEEVKGLAIGELSAAVRVAEGDSIEVVVVLETLDIV
ncbi:hypothetical protein QQS21_004097 [Conoideocrella luteorostrata]|uniref:Uncharacterized protein n=1 Tax=Conoideocrella luteorostrata TaxID=1105319 RepID=A0AAJ0CUJ9_9HYPO|nr:hypothetical protein QQS21_004097 [Conoideocrella luteorostrata]